MAARQRQGPADEAPARGLRLLERPPHPPQPPAQAGVPPGDRRGWWARTLARGLRWWAGPCGSRT